MSWAISALPSRRIGGVWSDTYDSPYAPIQALRQVSRCFSEQRVQVLYIEMEFGDLVLAARGDDFQTEPKSEARFKIDAVYLARVIRDHEARPPDLGHNFVGMPPTYSLLSIRNG